MPNVSSSWWRARIHGENVTKAFHCQWLWHGCLFVLGDRSELWLCVCDPSKAQCTALLSTPKSHTDLQRNLFCFYSQPFPVRFSITPGPSPAPHGCLPHLSPSCGQTCLLCSCSCFKQEAVLHQVRVVIHSMQSCLFHQPFSKDWKKPFPISCWMECETSCKQCMCSATELYSLFLYRSFMLPEVF